MKSNGLVHKPHACLTVLRSGRWKRRLSRRDIGLRGCSSGRQRRKTTSTDVQDPEPGDREVGCEEEDVGRVEGSVRVEQFVERSAQAGRDR